MIAALVIGTLLAVGALAFVLYPVFFGVSSAPTAAPLPRQSEREAAVSALREIEFDRATGKLSDTDYAALKTQYTELAVRAMRAEKSDVSPDVGDARALDPIEAAVLAYRKTHPACPDCGPRPEPDAEYCSRCGRYLHDRCADCGAPVEAHDARFCVSCGNRLAA